MILKGSQRAGGSQLAVHLLRTDENEHVEVHEVRGFVAEDLKGALREAYAISRGTRCKQYLFSLSLSPPETEKVPVEVFEDAIAAIEEMMGLVGQPRAIVFHEKEGRRHAHCVWSRIKADEMKAINLPHTHLKLRDVSRQLYMEYGWKMPRGLVNSEERDPTNYTRAEWQQAKRAGHSAKALKAMFQECWALSDSRTAFANALRARGYYLAQGDRRGCVAVDFRGEVYAISRWIDIRARQVAARLGKTEELPTVAETKARVTAMMTETIKRHIREAEAEFRARAYALDARRQKLAALHRQACVSPRRHAAVGAGEFRAASAGALRFGLRSGSGVQSGLAARQAMSPARHRDVVDYMRLGGSDQDVQPRTRLLQDGLRRHRTPSHDLK